MKFNVLNCERVSFTDSKTKEIRVMYKITGFVNGSDIKNGLMQFYSNTNFDVECEYNCHLTITSDMKNLKIVFDDKIQGSKGLFNK